MADSTQQAAPVAAAASSPRVVASTPLPAPAATAQGQQQPIAITVQMPATEVHWTAYATAVATPAIALIAVAAATYVGIRNWTTARDKLRLDLFEKRWEFYEAINQATIEMILHRFDDAKYKIYRQAVTKSYWLFDQKVQDYVEGPLQDHIQEFRDIGEAIGNEDAPETQQHLSDRLTNVLKWIVIDNGENLKVLFKDALKLRH